MRLSRIMHININMLHCIRNIRASKTLGWHLEEIHVTWAHLEKKRTRLRLYTSYFEEIVHTGRGDGVADFKRRRQDFQIDSVMDLTTASGHVYELPEGNNVVPLRSDTIRLVQNGCSFHGLRSEDPNQHLKDFLKLVDSLDLDVANRERTRLRLFQFSLRAQASNWLERLPAGSISTWEDLTNSSSHSYDNESGTTPSGSRPKPLKAISLPQDVLSTFDCRLIELENQVQRLMEAHLAPKQLVQVNKITSSCEICSAPHDAQYFMKHPEQAFVNYVSSHNNKVRVFSEKLDDTSTRDTAGDIMAYVNAASTDQIKKEELRSKGIKSPYKLLSLKYLSQTSLEEQNRIPSSPKRVHFIKYVIILRKEDEVREKENVNSNATQYNDHEMTAKAKENVEEESKDEFEEEIEEEEEEEEEDVEYFDTFPCLEELRYHE
ncbi:hypothetical protein Tco_1346622 [Tanacetum coccineum]